MIKIKRIYAAKNMEDGYRILVDRLWPRGIRKSDASIDEWWKEFAPTSELRVWFGHDVMRWNEFILKYTLELNENRAALVERLERIPKRPITLLYAAKDEHHNQAIVLQKYIRSRILNIKATCKQ